MKPSYWNPNSCRATLVPLRGLCCLLMLLALVAKPVVPTFAAQTATAESETEETESTETETSETEDESSEGKTEEKTEEKPEQKSEEKPEEKADSDPVSDKQEAYSKQDESKNADTKKSESEAAKQDTKQEAAPESSEEVESPPTMEVEPEKQADKEPEKKDDPPKQSTKPKGIIGSTATLLEKQSGLKFRARIDTGAKSCSLHVERVEIQDESTKEDVVERMTENIGKVITFVVKNSDGKTHILKRKIATYVIIKTSEAEGKRRYKVPLTFLWKNMEKEVLVTLNDRAHMDYPLLIGRNFLRGDFLVDVELNSDD